MDNHWIKATLTVFGILFAIGGAVGAFLQAKWLCDQRKTLRGILDVLKTIRGKNIMKKRSISNSGTPYRMLKD